MEFDDALQRVGEFGRFQCLNYALLVLPVAHTAIYMMTYVFAARDIPYRCFVPGCDSAETPELNPSWLSWALPPSSVPRLWPGQRAPSTCLRYVPRAPAAPEAPAAPAAPEACSQDAFTSETERCDRWVFPEHDRTVVSEFNITCEDNRWKLTIVGSLNNLGQLMGTPLSGAFSDRFGRRGLLLIALALSWLSGMARSCAPTYGTFLIFEFLDPFVASGIYSACFILGVELVAGRQRVFGSSLVGSFYSLGCALLGVLAWWQRDWRWLIRVSYLPAALSLLSVWLLPESVRWLLSVDRVEAAQSVMNRVAAVNRVPLSSPVRLRGPNTRPLPATLWARRTHPRDTCRLTSPACTTGPITVCPGCGGRGGRALGALGAVGAVGGGEDGADRHRSASLQPESERQRPPIKTLQCSQSPSTPNLLQGLDIPARASLAGVDGAVAGGWPLAQVCRSSHLMQRLCLTATLWVVNSFVYFGLALRSVALAGDIYLNFVLAALVEVPAYLLAWAVSERWGRRVCVCGTLSLTGISLLAFLFIPDGLVSVQLMLYMCGKLAITASFTVLYVFTAELFPTNARHSMIGVCSTIGRMGSALAPQTPLLEVFFWGLPILLFGVMSVGGACIALLLPETLNKALPDNVSQAEAVGKDRDVEEPAEKTRP